LTGHQREFQAFKDSTEHQANDFGLPGAGCCMATGVFPSSLFF
jgi:hypothetical protein